MFENLTVSEQLLFSTVRIECQLPGGRGSIGTGFFFSFNLPDGRNIPLLITNKHVVKDATSGTFLMTKRLAPGKPAFGQVAKVTLDKFHQRWIPHPEDSVDLCALPMAPLVEQARLNSVDTFRVAIGDDAVIQQAQLETLDAIEDVIMVGYPNGMWDSINNMPIVRRGITATHPAVDFERKPQSLLDIASFNGSSGSPVFIYSSGMRRDRNNNVTMGGASARLLGIMFASMVYTATGEIKTIDIPTSVVPIPATQLHTNLAVIVKAHKLLDFLPVFMNMSGNK